MTKKKFSISLHENIRVVKGKKWTLQADNRKEILKQKKYFRIILEFDPENIPDTPYTTLFPDENYFLFYLLVTLSYSFWIEKITETDKIIQADKFTLIQQPTNR